MTANNAVWERHKMNDHRFGRWESSVGDMTGGRRNNNAWSRFAMLESTTQTTTPFFVLFGALWSICGGGGSSAPACRVGLDV